MLIQWNGSKWTGNDIPDFGNAAPGTPTGPFIMQPEGMGRLFAINKMAEGPFPEHYEPIETPLALTRCIRTWCLTRLFVCMNKTRCGWVKKSSSRMWVRPIV